MRSKLFLMNYWTSFNSACVKRSHKYAGLQHFATVFAITIMIPCVHTFKRKGNGLVLYYMVASSLMHGH